MNEFSTTDFYGFDRPAEFMNRGTPPKFDFKFVPAERMERLLRNLEIKESRCSRTKKLWEDFCRSEKSYTTLQDNISTCSKPLHPILKNKTSNESVRTLSETEIDSLISKANIHQKRIHDEFEIIKKSLEPQESQESLEDEPTPRLLPETNAAKNSDLNLNLGSISVRSGVSGKSENLSEYHFSHRSNSNKSDDIHMYKLVIGNSNSSISENRSNQSTTRSVSSYKKDRKDRNDRKKRVKRCPSKYNILSAKEHLEMQRILGIENLLKRDNQIEKPKRESPDLELIENELNINEIHNIFSMDYAKPTENITSRTSRGSSPIDFSKIEEPIESNRSAAVPTELRTERSQRESPNKNQQAAPVPLPEDRVSPKRSPTRRISQQRKSPRSVSPKKSTRDSIRSFSPDSKKNFKSTERVPELSKSVCNLIENMKNEKQGLLSRITEYQEKICDLLIKLHMSLDDTNNIPDTDRDIERSRKEKYVTEFTARFARNFLYPLDGAIKEVEDIDKADFLNILSNDPSTKVCALFGLLHQAVSTYYKQLRHLLLDNCPRRLDVLVKYISKTIEMSLTKRIFHKDDVLIVRLQEKTRVLSLRLQEIKQQRKVELEMCIKPRDPEKAKKKKVTRYAPMTLDMYNSKVSEKKLKSVRSKPSLASPKKKVEELQVPEIKTKQTPRFRKKRTALKRRNLKSVRETGGADELMSAHSRKIETQIERINDDL
ncbi:hypothetical protein ACFFRR_002331 [Megaselia abdita]